MPVGHSMVGGGGDPGGAECGDSSLDQRGVALAIMVLGATVHRVGRVVPTTLASAQTVDAVLVTVRIGNDGTFDRVVFEFSGDITVQATVDGPTANPGTIHFDPSDELIPVARRPVDRRAHRRRPPLGAVAPPDPPYDGPTTITPTDTANVVQVVEAGDFEAVLNWAIGVRSPTTPTVTVLTDPVRVVVDIPHAAATPASPVTQPATFTG